MGTNYYLKTSCECCEQETILHLGKRSCGWRFTFHIYPDEGLNNSQEIMEYLHRIISKNDSRIINEYSEELTLEEFKTLVKETLINEGLKQPDKYGYNIESRDFC